MSDLNYQKKWGPDVPCQKVPLASSVAFKYLSGKFLYKDASYQYALCDDATSTTAVPVGWAVVGQFTSNSTAAIDNIPLNMSKEAVYEMPADEDFTAAEGKALVLKTCDIVINDGIQQADIGASTYDVIQIVGYDVGAQTVFVRLAERSGVTAHTGV